MKHWLEVEVARRQTVVFCLEIDDEHPAWMDALRGRGGDRAQKLAFLAEQVATLAIEVTGADVEGFDWRVERAELCLEDDSEIAYVVPPATPAQVRLWRERQGEKVLEGVR